jgi:hypothetical protein
MRNWKRTVNIKPVIFDDDMTVEEKGRTIALLLDAEPYFTGTFFSEEIADAGKEGDVEWFDSVLSDIYDFADDNDIWMGP